MLSAFHGLVGRRVETYGGVVLQHQGGGALMRFGLRKDGEDAALAASLSLAAEAPGRLRAAELRVGLHTGTVRCRIAGPTIRPRTTGFDVSLAARIQAEAAPGRVVISEATGDFVARWPGCGSARPAGAPSRASPTR